ncbi:MAG: glycosyltransferase family 39 protein [Candidatus Krumholzibacteriota bacterium]|nr:glycosyltransferase family 39 protein [Candidatus Krumholzibacteriota bacterium]
MRHSFNKKHTLILLLVIAAGAALRIYGLGWELPEVYEEATPLVKAWEMWGWGTARPADLNPHFFNYPGLVIYIHFLLQGALFLSMKVAGMISSAAEFYALYIVDKTAFYYSGRLVNALFGIAAISAVYLAGKSIAGRMPGIISATLLAVNTFHIAKSQLIEVDIPLTFLIIIALLNMTALARKDCLRNRILTGLFIGLAVSAKYTAALLLIPLLVTVWMMSTGGHAALKERRFSYSRVSSFLSPLCATAMIALAVFLITSPYTILDWRAFRAALSFEQHHMYAGHFGTEGSSSLSFYTRSISRILPGWPLFILSAIGLVYFAFIKRERGSIIFASFLVPYFLIISSWSMKADNYILPVVPLLLIFSSTAFVSMSSYILSRKISRFIAYSSIALLSVLTAAPLIASVPEHLQRLNPDTRTITKRWIENNIPPGSFVVTEAYGPNFIKPQVIAAVPPEIRNIIKDRYGDLLKYAVLPVPMFQSLPGRSDGFYDLSLYNMADIIIISSSVASRYLKDPERFPRQLAFYRELRKDYRIVFETSSEGCSGPVLTVFRNPRHEAQFAARRDVDFPSLLKEAGSGPSGSEELFYLDLGLNYEAFNFYRQAIASFQLAFEFPVIRTASYNSLILGMTRSLIALDKPEKAVELLEEAGRSAPARSSRESFKKLGQRIRTNSGI